MAAGQQSAKLRRVPGIDGLRGLAVIAVVFYHFFKPAFHGGFLGVDVFFVLSGFLITSLLIREQATTRRISLKNFWARRIRRILPAAFSVMATIAAITLVIAGNSQVGMGWQMLAILTFSNNWMQIIQSHSYFADTVPQVFSHYWSLSVEEQFYVLWPLIFVLLCLIGARRNHWLVITSLMGLGTASLMAVLYHPGVDPTRVYYGTDTHAFGLVLGAFLAFFMSSRSASMLADSWPKYQTETLHPRLSAALALLSLAGLTVMFVLLPDQGAITYRGGIVVASLLTGVVLWAVVQELPIITPIFNNKVLRWIGQRSFSLYLWHWPLIVIVSEPFRTHGEKHSIIAGILSLALTIPIAAFWYRFVERPFHRNGVIVTIQQLFTPLRHPRKTTKRSVLKNAAIVAVSLIVAICAVASGITAPNESQIERDLEALRPRGTHSRPGLARLWEIQPEKRTFPSGSDITALGDSVMLASLPALEQTFPGIYVNADVSRAWIWAPDHIREMKANNTLDQFVIIGLGTNGNAGPGEIDDVIREIGPERVIILISPYGDRPWMEKSRDQIRAAVRKYPNIYLADWYTAVTNDPTVVREDGIHPGEEGGLLYARLIKRALLRWVDYGPRM